MARYWEAPSSSSQAAVFAAFTAAVTLRLYETPGDNLVEYETILLGNLTDDDNYMVRNSFSTTRD